MADYKGAFIRYMDEKGVKYQTLSGGQIRITYNADNMKTIPIIVFFDDEGKGLVEFICFQIASFNGDKFDKGLRVCNDLNSKYRWVKFCIDKDNDVLCKMDAMLDINTAGEECMSLVRRMVGIIDETYPEFMKALWA